MPTYAWNRTREQVRDMVLRKLGVIGAADIAEPEDSELVYEAMNARLKELQTEFPLWWLVAGAQTSLTLTSGTATAAVSAADFALPVSASIFIGAQEKPLRIIGHRQYQAIQDKAQTGEPESVFFHGATARFHPVPAANYSARLTYQATAKDVETGEPLDMPPAAVRAFVDIVAGDLVEDFGIEPNKAARLVAKQEPAVRALRRVAAESVDSATVTPDWY